MTTLTLFLGSVAFGLSVAAFIMADGALREIDKLVGILDARERRRELHEDSSPSDKD